MKKQLSYGYPLPPEDAAVIEEFFFSIGDVELVPGSTDGQAWDYESPVSCSVTLSVDLERILRGCGLAGPSHPPTATRPRVSAGLTWFSSATKLRGSGEQKLLRDGENTLSVRVDGSELGGNFLVKAVIALMEDVEPIEGVLSPQTRGSILWSSEELELPLEGQGARLAMTPLDFAKAGIEPIDAMWLVQLSDRLEIPVASGVRVLVNTSHPVTRNMLENLSAPEAGFWQKELEADILTLLINHGGANLEPVDLETDAEIGSLEETIRNNAAALFPHDALEDLASEAPRVSATIRASIFNRKEQ